MGTVPLTRRIFVASGLAMGLLTRAGYCTCLYCSYAIKMAIGSGVRGNGKENFRTFKSNEGDANAISP